MPEASREAGLALERLTHGLLPPRPMTARAAMAFTEWRTAHFTAR
jgi:hypothetical protein